MTVVIRQMTLDDIPTGMRLKAQNGWNQVEEDWRRQLALQPDGCFVAESNGEVVGTACACIFDNVAWVNLVLVDKLHRGRGIGTSLMRYVLGYLDERRIPTIRLDATPLGRPIYEKLGFVDDYSLTRFEGALSADLVSEPPVDVQPAEKSDLPTLMELDFEVTGTHRTRLLAYLFDEAADPILVIRPAVGTGPAYASYRPGARAWKIGPCLGDARGCRRLLEAIAHRLRRHSVFMDIPDDHREAKDFAAQLKLTPQRQLFRMTRGAKLHELLAMHWCSFGPEKG